MAAQQVHIDQRAISRFCDALQGQVPPVPAWNTDVHFFDGSERTLWYILVLDTLNFCFWGDPHWRVQFKTRWVDGYWALAAALTRAFWEGIPLDSAEYLARLSPQDLAYILRGEGEVPLIAERLANLRELGTVLLNKFGGRPTQLLASVGWDAVLLAHMMADSFHSFRDKARYQGMTVWFLKRAQILAADIAGCFGFRGLGALRSVTELTAFADYKLPQLLRHWGILVYDEDLSARVDRQELIPPGAPEEVEIRACTIWAVEMIRQELSRWGHSLPAYQVDWYLWETSQHLPLDTRPHHRTRTVFY